MKSKIHFLLFTVLFAVGVCARASAQNWYSATPQMFLAIQETQTNNVQLVIEGKIINVHDGDTVTVLDKDSKKFHIRLSGIDAPEIKQTYGAQSQKNLSNMVMGKQVTIVWTKVDKYRRTVGTIMLDGRDINIEQVKAGLAWHFKKYADEQDPQDRITYAKAEELARAARLGLWEDPNPKPPSDYRVDVKLARWGPPPPAGTVIGNRGSQKYHRPECPGYRDMAEKNRVFFKSVEEAEAAGFKRAGNCPPQSEIASARVTTVASTAQNVPQVETTAATQPATTTPTTTPTKVAPSYNTITLLPPTEEGDLIGNKNSKVYHKPGCPGYKNVSEKNRVFFKTAQEAEAAGYKLAGNCTSEASTASTSTPPATETKPTNTVTLISTPSTTTTTSSSAVGEGEIIGNKNSKKFHAPGCPGYKSVSEKNQVKFKTVAEAEAAGYERAGNCKSDSAGASETSGAKATPVAASTTAKAAVAPASTTPLNIIGNKDSKIYLRADCPGYNDVPEKNQVKFKSIADAEAAGYKRAEVCTSEPPPVATPTTAVTTTAPASSGAQEIIGNKNSKIYHRPDCPGYNNVSEKNQVKFKSVAEAEAAGFRAAKNCP